SHLTPGCAPWSPRLGSPDTLPSTYSTQRVGSRFGASDLLIQRKLKLLDPASRFPARSTGSFDSERNLPDSLILRLSTSASYSARHSESVPRQRDHPPSLPPFLFQFPQSLQARRTPAPGHTNALNSSVVTSLRLLVEVPLVSAFFVQAPLSAVMTFGPACCSFGD
ncbi:hypothetical protein AMEX_G14174, partial [Astyanax mexicanus]